MAGGGARTGEARAPAMTGGTELVDLLGLAASQIEVALRESEPPVARLAGIVAGLGTTEAGSAAATALQFHDRLRQRLTHVRDTLAALARFLGEHSHRGAGDHWESLRREIRGRYSMEQERVMFDLLVGGATPDQVLETLTEMRATGAAGRVDLF